MIFKTQTSVRQPKLTIGMKAKNLKLVKDRKENPIRTPLLRQLVEYLTKLHLIKRIMEQD